MALWWLKSGTSWYCMSFKIIPLSMGFDAWKLSDLHQQQDNLSALKECSAFQGNHCTFSFHEDMRNRVPAFRFVHAHWSRGDRNGSFWRRRSSPSAGADRGLMQLWRPSTPIVVSRMGFQAQEWFGHGIKWHMSLQAQAVLFFFKNGADLFLPNFRNLLLWNLYKWPRHRRLKPWNVWPKKRTTRSCEDVALENQMH